MNLQECIIHCQFQCIYTHSHPLFVLTLVSATQSTQYQPVSLEIYTHLRPLFVLTLVSANQLAPLSQATQFHYNSHLHCSVHLTLYSPCCPPTYLPSTPDGPLCPSLPPSHLSSFLLPLSFNKIIPIRILYSYLPLYQPFRPLGISQSAGSVSACQFR